VPCVKVINNNNHNNSVERIPSLTLAGAQVVEKIWAFYGNRTFAAALKTSGKWILLEVDERKLKVSFLHNLKELRDVYVAGSPTQAEFCASRKAVYTSSNKCVFTVHGGPAEIQKCNPIEQERRRNDSSAACAVAHRQSSASFVSLRFESPKNTLVRFWKMSLFNFYIYLTVA
jgi:hypothetical protein